MIKTALYLPKYDWIVYVFVAVDEYYTYEILDKMRQIGADRHSLARAHKNLTDGEINGGISFTNPNLRKSVWVTEITSSAAEFLDSMVHEIRHLQQHIANEYGIDQNSEEVCYLCGDIAYRLFPYCKKLLCEHCRNNE